MTEFEKILYEDAGYVTYMDCQQGLPVYRLQYYSKKLEVAIAVESRNIRTLFAKFVERYKDLRQLNFEMKIEAAVAKVKNARTKNKRLRA